MSVSLTGTDLKRIVQIMRQYGESLSDYREGFLRRRIANRFRKTGARSATAYISLLRNNPEEASALKRELTVNVTEFFRDPSTWPEIESLVVGLLRDRGSIRMWSAGTASGEEAYSLAILGLRSVRRLRSRLPGAAQNRVYVLGTDMSHSSLNAARIGVYPDVRIRNVSQGDRHFFFEEVDEGWYSVRDRVRDVVSFRYDDLAHSRVKDKMDIILCRNVMIYLSRDVIEEIWLNLRKVVRHGGYIVLGRSENIIHRERNYFEVVDPVNRIYRRI